MRPFVITFIFAATGVTALWWHQRCVLQDLRAGLAAKAAEVPASAVGKDPPSKPVRKKSPPKVALQHPDGSPVVTARGQLRGILEAATFVRSLDRGALEKLLTDEDPDDMGESGGLTLAGWARLGEMDPRAALVLAAKGKPEGFYVVMHDWLIRDRAAALQWFREQPDSEEKANFLMVAGFVLAASDPDLLGQLTGSITDPELHGKSLALSIVSQSITDLDAAIARAGELKDPAVRDEVLQGLYGMHGDTHPRQLLELMLPSALEGTASKPMIGMLVRTESVRDPAEALEWIVSRTPEEVAALRTPSFQLNIGSIGNLELSAVQAAASRLENAADREWIMANYYTGSTRTAPLAALEGLSGAVTDTPLRSDVITAVLARAVRAGRESEVEPWLAAQPVTEQSALRTQMATWKANAAKAAQ